MDDGTMTYGDAIIWCVRHEAVFRFVERRSRSEFIATNESIPGDKSLELAVTVAGKTLVVHCPLDSSKERSGAVASALISSVKFFDEKLAQRTAMVQGSVN